MSQQTLFNTMPPNGSPFWDEVSDDLDYKKVARTFFDRKEKIGQLTGVSKSSVRYDRKMPDEVKLFLQSMAVIFHLVYSHFGHDFDKAKMWFELPNPMIGERVTPKEMIHIGRHEKLLQIISSALGEEVP